MLFVYHRHNNIEQRLAEALELLRGFEKLRGGAGAPGGGGLASGQAPGRADKYENMTNSITIEQTIICLKKRPDARAWSPEVNARWTLGDAATIGFHGIIQDSYFLCRRCKQ